ncbi:hypothetical protein [Actinokineospora inagensis]|uniref:hypothetical protein n=1 Tax=Actinokineospora inagensis TaxID=103730 RepID=UPI00040F6534|nr:hypothetical protein [Actinokineospora inagensis]
MNADLGSAESLRCSLCHRELPVSLLRLAHIKRRAEATAKERLNTANTMPTCTLGAMNCSNAAYVLVDACGRSYRNARVSGITDDLDVALARFDGQKVLAFNSASAPFFAEHALRHTGVL